MVSVNPAIANLFEYSKILYFSGTSPTADTISYRAPANSFEEVPEAIAILRTSFEIFLKLSSEIVSTFFMFDSKSANCLPAMVV